MIEFTTKSGSTYHMDIEGRRLRRAERSSASKSERMGDGGWRTYERADFPVVGRPVTVYWGQGRDEHSALATQIGDQEVPDEAVTRMTQTTPVVEVRVLGTLATG